MRAVTMMKRGVAMLVASIACLGAGGGYAQSLDHALIEELRCEGAPMSFQLAAYRLLSQSAMVERVSFQGGTALMGTPESPSPVALGARLKVMAVLGRDDSKIALVAAIFPAGWDWRSTVKKEWGVDSVSLAPMRSTALAALGFKQAGVSVDPIKGQRKLVVGVLANGLSAMACASPEQIDQILRP